MSQSNSSTTSVFPLQIHWIDNSSPLYKSFPAHSLKEFLNTYFKERNKQIKIVQIVYEEIQKIKLASTENQSDNIDYQSQNTNLILQEEKINLRQEHDIKVLNRAFLKNISVIAELYLYGKPSIHLAETKQIRHRFPTMAKIRAKVEIARQQYNTLDNFAVTNKNGFFNPVFLHHPQMHRQFIKTTSRKYTIDSWTLSFEPTYHTISHYINFKFVKQMSQKINNRLIFKTYILQNNTFEFDIISQIFNGIILKLRISKDQIKRCRLFEGEQSDIFYFSLAHEPSLFGLPFDWRVCRDIEYQQNWLPYPSFLSCAKYYQFRNHPLFQSYFLNNNIISIETERLGQASIYFRGFCYQIKQRFHIINQQIKNTHILSVLSKLNNNYYIQVMGNMFIDQSTKMRLMNVLHQLIVNGQLDMMETLELFQIQEFAVNIEIYLSVLELMLGNGGFELNWIKTVYKSLINQNSYLYYAYGQNLQYV